jgi:hypothetical protein
MNERMIELYKQASEFAYKICKDEGRIGGPSDHIWNTLSTGRFAELIVKECAYINFYKRTDISLKDAYRVSQVILEHFGVES